MKEIINIVIDLETAATTPNAAILSIAAVPFGFDLDPKDETSVFRPTLSDGTRVNAVPFYKVVNANSCVVMGMDFDADTVKWWAKQSEEAKQQLLVADAIHIADAMHQFILWANDIRERYNAELRIWSQGLDFDLPILRNAVMKTCPGETLPWHYTEQRDARTYCLSELSRLIGDTDRSLYSFIPPCPLSRNIKHSSLCDASQTAWNIVNSYHETPVILCAANICKEEKLSGSSTSDTIRK